LRGQTIGMSGYFSGIDSVFRDHLARAGLKKESDYTVRDFLGGSWRRTQALEMGSVAAVFVAAEDARLLEDRGFHRVDAPFVEDVIAVTSFNQQWSAGIRRADARRFLDATFESIRWLKTPANRAEAVGILQTRLGKSRAVVERAYDDYVGRDVFAEHGEFRRDRPKAISPLVDEQLRREAAGSCRR